jgi:16S rRNA U1498 N3-methylase RsmE
MSEFQISPSENNLKILPSENILQLRKLTEQICNVKPDGDCIIDKLKNAIELGTEDILSSKTERTKLKYYEKMFSEIKTIINENK